jgi:hypothetical protein
VKRMIANLASPSCATSSTASALRRLFGSRIEMDSDIAVGSRRDPSLVAGRRLLALV